MAAVPQLVVVLVLAAGRDTLGIARPPMVQLRTRAQSQGLLFQPQGQKRHRSVPPRQTQPFRTIHRHRGRSMQVDNPAC
jgi:hypothetical protein